MDIRTGEWASNGWVTISNWSVDHQGLIVGTGATLVVCGAALGIRSIYRRWLKYHLLGLWYKGVRNPLNRYLVHPLRRWKNRREGIQMAKWRKSYVADLIYGHILDDLHAEKINAIEAKRICHILGEEYKDLLPRKFHSGAIKNHLRKNKTHEVGPVKPIPGPKPGEAVVVEYNGIGSKYLSRKKVA